MKKETNSIFSKILGYSFLTIIAAIVLGSCIKDDDGIPKVNSNGTPVITKVYLLDTLARIRDSSIVGADPYKLLVISGENLGGVKTVSFNGFSTSFNPTYNTDKSLIIRLPAEAPTGAKASNKLMVVTANGEATFDFRIIAKAAVYSADKITFGADRGDVTLTGKNFEDVSSVMLSGTKTEVQVISKTKDVVGVEKMVLRFPKTNISQATLDITNSSGTYVTINNSFVNADEAFVIFADSIAKDFANNSWGDPFVVNADQAFAGKNSISKSYAGGNWHLAAFSNWWPSVAYNADYKYFPFAVKGGNNPINLWITTDAGNAGFGDFVEKNKIAVPAKIWSYYKVALKDIDFWKPGSTLKQFGWRTQGPDKTEVIYFDDVMFLK
jgi:hypothetical protein